PELQGKWFALFDNYVYGNQNAVDFYLRHGVEMPRDLARLKAAIPELIARFAWIRTLPAEWHEGLGRYQAAIATVMAEPLDGKSLVALWDYVCRVNALGRDYFKSNIAISIGHTYLVGSLRGLLHMVMGEAEGARALDDLLGATETRTSAINAELRG